MNTGGKTDKSFACTTDTKEISNWNTEESIF